MKGGREKKDSHRVPQQRQIKDNWRETDEGWEGDQKPVFAFRALVRNSFEEEKVQN